MREEKKIYIIYIDIYIIYEQSKRRSIKESVRKRAREKEREKE